MFAHLMIILLIAVLFLNVPYVTGKIVSESETRAIDSWMIGASVLVFSAALVYLVYTLFSLFINII